MMIQLSYISSVPAPMTTEALVGLLQTCLANNQRQAVTGMLVYGNETFLQTLEGEADVVDALYAKIAADPRHENVKSLTRRSVETRQYSDWTMGFKRVSDVDLSDVEGLIDFSEKQFTYKYLAAHEADARRLMDHFSSWDPLLRQIEEKDEAVRHVRAMLAHARGCVEIATLVLENVAAAGKVGPLEGEHLRLCEVALSALRQVPGMVGAAEIGVGGA